jgi:hypothetical protein
MENVEAEAKELELRMYFFTMYQLMGMQGGIQSGHSALRYVLKYGRYNPDHIIWDFIEKYQTWVVLNGGTTNDDIDFDGVPLGSLNQIGDGLMHNDIEFSFFREPDINNSLTALCFICDERVFNKKDYPDFLDYVYEKNEPLDGAAKLRLRMKTIEDLQEEYNSLYKEWVRLVGGVKNVYLRELLKGKKYA